MEFWGKVTPLLKLRVTGGRDFLIECDLSEATRRLECLEHVVRTSGRDNDSLQALSCGSNHLKIEVLIIIINYQVVYNILVTAPVQKLHCIGIGLGFSL